MDGAKYMGLGAGSYARDMAYGFGRSVGKMGEWMHAVFQQDIFAPHIHDPNFPGNVRPALPWEIPK